MLFFTFVYYKLQMLDSDEDDEQPFKLRLNHLKYYIRNLKQQLNFYEPTHSQTPHQPYSVNVPQAYVPPKLLSRPVPQSSLQKQKERLLSLIQAKQKKLGLNLSQRKEGKQKQKKEPSTVWVYVSKTRIHEKLEKVGAVLSQHDWEECRLYQRSGGLILVGINCLHVDTIFFSSLDSKSMQISNNYLLFRAFYHSAERFYVFKFANKQNSGKWFKFLNNIASIHQNRDLQQKWNPLGLSPKSKIQVSKVAQNSSPAPEQKKNLPKIPVLDLVSSNKFDYPNSNNRPHLQEPQEKKNKISSSKLENKKKSTLKNKDTISNSSFFLSNSSERSSRQKKQIAAIISEELFHSFKFGFNDQKKEKQKEKEKEKKLQKQYHNASQRRETVKYLNVPRLQQSESLIMTMKLMDKLEEKKKLLSDSSTTKLGIHWHEDIEEKDNHYNIESIPEINSPQRYIPSPTRVVRNKISVSTRKNELSTRRDSNQSPIKIKRVQSATREKSNSRDSQVNMEFQSGLRKKTDFSLQIQSGYETGRRKTSRRQQIQDNYLQKLLNKEGVIREISKSSSKQSSEKPVQNLLLVPQKKQSFLQLSKYGSNANLPNTSMLQQSNTLSQQKDSADNEVQLQQLKNGIVLQKCSKNAWNTKQKKLFISNALTQICYCDVNNLHEEKKYLIRDILSVQYGRVTRGILKHKKKRCDQSRCLVIRIDFQGKEKFLQFYLEDSEPVQNLKEFAIKLQSFIQGQNRHEAQEQIQED